MGNEPVKNRVSDFAFLYLCFVIYSFVSVFAKIAALQDKLIMTLVFMGGEFLLLAVYAILWQQALKKFPLMVAMSNKGVTVILGLIWSVLFFSETVTMFNIIGALLIVTGIWMVSSDG